MLAKKIIASVFISTGLITAPISPVSVEAQPIAEAPVVYESTIQAPEAIVVNDVITSVNDGVIEKESVRVGEEDMSWMRSADQIDFGDVTFDECFIK